MSSLEQPTHEVAQTPAAAQVFIPPQPEGGLLVDYPLPGFAVITVGGAIDDASLPRFAELVRHRLSSVIDVLVVDLSDVEFLSVSGLELLGNASARARSRDISIRLVARTHAVRRALRVAGLHEAVACYDDADEALSLPAGPLPGQEVAGRM